MEFPIKIDNHIKNYLYTVFMREGSTPASSSKQFKLWQPWLDDKDDSAKQICAKQLPTTKWKRDRRVRNEYSRKSDPKLPDNFDQELGRSTSPESAVPTPQSTNGYQLISNGHHKNGTEAPLDMSVRQRGQPPSYAQTISNPSFRSSYRSTVITQNATKDDFPSGISMCDPIIDEHFRRSLGKDYVTIFPKNNASKDVHPPKVKPKKNSTRDVVESIDNADMSVDEHFAKALGDTWLKLNKKNGKTKNGTTEAQGVVTVSLS